MLNQDQVSAEIKKQLEDIDIASLVNRSVLRTLDAVVAKLVQKTLESLLPDINKTISENIHTHLDNNMRMAVKSNIDHLDVKKLLRDSITGHLDVKIKEFNFPESSISAKCMRWDDVSFSGDMIRGGIIRNFNSTGIQDQATDCQLTIVDGVIVAEGVLISKEIRSDDARFKKLSVEGQLSVEGGLSLSDLAKQSMVQIFSDLLNKKLTGVGVELGEGAVKSGRNLLLDSTTLGPSVINSNIRRLGLLQDLRVSGPSNLADTLIVTEGNRVGLNTDEPSGVLTIWDDDAELTVAKLSRRNMFVGSTRQTDVSLGTDNRMQLRISADGIDISDPVTIQGIRFSVMDDVPEGIGTQHEMVLVRNAREGQPRFYICEGGNRWRALI